MSLSSLFAPLPVHFKRIEELILPSERALKESERTTNDSDPAALRKTLRKIANKNEKQSMSQLREWKRRQLREKKDKSAFELVLGGESVKRDGTVNLEGSGMQEGSNEEEQKNDAPEDSKSSQKDSSLPFEAPTADEDPSTAPLTYRVSRTENKVIPCILEQNGFTPSRSEANFNVFWCGSHLRAYLFKSLNVFQKVNHFPKSFELTRKSNMYRKYMSMKTRFPDAYDYLPRTWVLPKDFTALSQVLEKKKFNEWFIVKPASSSSGRGISLVNNVTELLEATDGGAERTSSPDEEYVCSDYVADPLLVNGFKFDLRLYVAVTSYNPLRIYLYEDGLVRFSAEKYSLDPLNQSNTFIHLTNFTINKNSDKFVFNTDEAEDGVGNKWSIRALRTYLRHEGIDDELLWRRIEDVVIKSILTVEADQRSALRSFVPHPHTNCFELFGFDVLIDADLKPWVMEINLSPSLSIGTPLDKKIKVGMLTDLFNMIDVRRYSTSKYRELRHQKKSITANQLYQNETLDSRQSNLVKGLHGEQRTVLVQTLKEEERKGDFKRIFPSKDSHVYQEYMASYPGLNALLHEKLYGGNAGSSSARRSMGRFHGSELLGKRLTFSSERLPKSAPATARSLSPQKPSPNRSNSNASSPSSPNVARTLSLAQPKQRASKPKLSLDLDEPGLNLNTLLANKSHENAIFKLENGSPQGSYSTPVRFQNFVHRKREGKTVVKALTPPTNKTRQMQPVVSTYNLSFQ